MHDVEALSEVFFMVNKNESQQVKYRHSKEWLRYTHNFATGTYKQTCRNNRTYVHMSLQQSSFKLLEERRGVSGNPFRTEGYTRTKQHCLSALYSSTPFTRCSTAETESRRQARVMMRAARGRPSSRHPDTSLLTRLPLLLSVRHYVTSLTVQGLQLHP